MPFSVINDHAIIFITTNVKNRWWYFVTPERATTLGQAIQTCCDLKGFELLAYCILPNHVHFLVKGNSKKGTLGSVPQRSESNPPSRYLFIDRRLPSRRSVEHSPKLSDLMHSIKSTFSQSLRLGTFWQRRSYILHVESENYLATLIDYIRFNYTKMNLPERYGKSPFVLVNDKKIRNLF